MSAIPTGDLAGRVALVTGSSRGIGAVIAADLAQHGAAVAVHGRDAAATSAVAAGIQRGGGTAIAVTGDVTRSSDLDHIREQVQATVGPVDVLVANAGGSHIAPGPIESITEDDWRAVIDGNLLATFLTLKAFLPGMKQRRRGSIITLGSSAGRRANGLAPAPYSAAKAGVILLTQQVAAQAGPFGVRANCLAPETILTESLRSRIPPAKQEAMAGAHPLRRLGTPDDVADAATFLAGERSAWITGAVLDITGGAALV
ncbi:SDR family NAD(P)-dependent oxidoreductase [Leekyejoonella antrihumi]|uniref:SDR family oxidoreductase n=1 Tax=Leekyejoonella antrihumi TaxID=1660198 RepID=A0A563E941_9MICO|nr:SDR family NAD(P)-dependent oxidoreductase [Leekyejoonella antrihumi]TWP38324.1 SDR family oxidoreductase [Leekyejoonella antrihumi]